MKNLLKFSFLLWYGSCILGSHGSGSQTQTEVVTSGIDRSAVTAAVTAITLSNQQEFDVRRMIYDSAMRMRQDKQDVKKVEEAQAVAVQWGKKYQGDVNYHAANYQQATDPRNIITVDAVMALWYENPFMLTACDQMRCLKINQQEQELYLLRNFSDYQQWEYFDLSIADRKLLSPGQLIEDLAQKLQLAKRDFQEKLFQDQTELRAKPILPWLQQAQLALAQQNQYIQHLVDQQQALIANHSVCQDIHSRLVEQLYGDGQAAKLEKWAALAAQVLQRSDALDLLRTRLENPVARWQKKRQAKLAEQQRRLEELQRELTESTKMNQEEGRTRVVIMFEAEQLEKIAAAKREIIRLEEEQARELLLLEQAQQAAVAKAEKDRIAAEVLLQQQEEQLKIVAELEEKDRLLKIAQENNKEARRLKKERAEAKKTLAKKQERELEESRIAAEILRKQEESKSAETGEEQIGASSIVLKEESKSANVIEEAVSSIIAQPIRKTFRQFEAEIRQCEADREKFVKKLQKDRSLLVSQRHQKLQIYDNEQPFIVIKSILQTYAQGVCDPVLTEKKISGLLFLVNSILQGHQQALSDNERMAWYMFLYNRDDRYFNALYKKVEQKIAEFDEEFSGQTEQNIANMQHLRQLAYDNAVSELEAYQTSLDDAKARKKSAKEFGNEEAAKVENEIIRERLSEVVQRTQQIAKIKESINHYQQQAYRMEVYNMMKLLHGPGGILVTSGISPDVIVLHQGVLSKEFLEIQFEGLEAKMRAILLPLIDLEEGAQTRDLSMVDDESMVHNSVKAVKDEVYRELHNIFQHIGLSEADIKIWADHSYEIVRKMSSSYAKNIVDRDNVEDHFYQNNISQNAQIDRRYSVVQMQDVTQVQMRLLASISRVFNQ